MVAMLNRIINPLVKLILRLPLHRLLSGHTMLVTVTGRKTGKPYTTPVNYIREGNTVTVISRKNRTWWKNLRGGAGVTLRIKGKILKGYSRTIVEDEETVAATLKWFYGKVSPVRISPQIARHLASNSVAIRIQITDGPREAD